MRDYRTILFPYEVLKRLLEAQGNPDQQNLMAAYLASNKTQFGFHLQGFLYNCISYVGGHINRDTATLAANTSLPRFRDAFPEEKDIAELIEQIHYKLFRP